jgi:periplasmic nitrate reductase NapE
MAATHRDTGTGTLAAEPGRKRRELWAFLFLTVVLFPVLAVLIVSGYGFAVWVSQMIFGPPGV